MSSPTSLRKSLSFPIDRPVEARELWTCRPVRKAICFLCIAASGYFLLSCVSQETYPSYSPLSMYRSSRSDGTSTSRWVGGGATVAISNGQVTLDASDKEAASGQHTTGEGLPQILRIPLQEGVADVDLDGWEDDWFAYGRYDAEKHGRLQEPKIDFVYNWVNGSEVGFNELRHKYEIESPLNDPEGKWIQEHGVNRYRDWNELRYSLRSIDTNAFTFLNRVQILVNSVRNSSNIDTSRDREAARQYEYRNDGESMRPQRPTWMRDDIESDKRLQILPQEDFFSTESQSCLPTFNSLSIESQIHLTPSNTDRVVALSDDMLLGMPHAASDFYSPLFGSVMAFKPEKYNVQSLGSRDKWPTFGEKPFLYYTSYLLNHRFGERGRRVQAHFAHSISRSVMSEAMSSFPGPTQHGTCERFRGESHFQLYPWFTAFHYSIERFREALLWSFIVSRSDANSDGYLDWDERQQILQAIEPGWARVVRADPGQSQEDFLRQQQQILAPEGDLGSVPVQDDPSRERMYYRLGEELEAAGLEKPKANVNVLWTSLDGPETIRDIKCFDFSIDKCMGDSFASPISDAAGGHNPDFSADAILSRLSTQHPKCGDCLIKFVLSTAAAKVEAEDEDKVETPNAETGTPQPNKPRRKHRGLEPLLPPSSGNKKQQRDRAVVIRALKKYQHTVVDTDAMKFVMVKDAEQAERELLERNVRLGRKFGQWCLNDDVLTEDQGEVGKVKAVIGGFFEEQWPRRSSWEREDS